MGRWSERTVVACVVVLLALGACSGSDSSSAPSATGERSAPSTTGERGPFPPGTFTAPPGEEQDCGEYTRTSPAGLGTVDPFVEEHACIRQALASGTPAVLVEHYGTVEGDPIRRQYRVVAVNQVEVTWDTTRDQFGGQGIWTQECTGLLINDGVLYGEPCEDSAGS